MIMKKGKPLPPSCHAVQSEVREIHHLPSHFPQALLRWSTFVKILSTWKLSKFADFRGQQDLFGNLHRKFRNFYRCQICWSFGYSNSPTRNWGQRSGLNVRLRFFPDMHWFGELRFGIFTGLITFCKILSILLFFDRRFGEVN